MKELSMTPSAIAGREWRKRNPESNRISVAKWSSANKERKSASSNLWKAKNKERRLLVKRMHYERARKRFHELKSAPCLDCGNTFPPECMDFDHVRGEKVIGVGLLVAGRIERLEEEIAKCDLVCANCHRIRTKKRREEKRDVGD